MSKEKQDRILWIQSGISDKGPFIQFFVNEEIICQMDIEQARNHALHILECAEASEQDHFLWQTLTERLKMPKEKAVEFLKDFRLYREEQTGKRGGPTSKEEFIITEKHKKLDPIHGPYCLNSRIIRAKKVYCGNFEGHNGDCDFTRSID